MRFDVLLDYLISHIARTGRKVSPRPQVSSPKLPVQLAKLLQHLPAASSFDPLHQLAHRYLGRYRYQQMDMVWRNVSFHDVHIRGRAGLSHQLSQSYPNFASQHWLSVLGNPHQMVFEVINRVRCLAVLHDRILLQTSLWSNPSGPSSQSLPRCHRLAARPDLDTSAVLKTACLKGRGFYPIYRQ